MNKAVQELPAAWRETWSKALKDPGSAEEAIAAAKKLGLHLPAPNPFIPEDLDLKAPDMLTFFFFLPRFLKVLKSHLLVVFRNSKRPTLRCPDVWSVAVWRGTSFTGKMTSIRAAKTAVVRWIFLTKMVHLRILTLVLLWVQTVESFHFWDETANILGPPKVFAAKGQAADILQVNSKKAAVFQFVLSVIFYLWSCEGAMHSMKQIENLQTLYELVEINRYQSDLESTPSREWQEIGSFGQAIFLCVIRSSFLPGTATDSLRATIWAHIVQEARSCVAMLTCKAMIILYRWNRKEATWRACLRQTCRQKWPHWVSPWIAAPMSGTERVFLWCGTRQLLVQSGHRWWRRDSHVLWMQKKNRHQA